MRNILIFVESRYPVNRKQVKKLTDEFLDSEKLKGNIEVSIVFVGDRKMKNLNKKYREKDETTTVLSFPLEEVTKTTQSGRAGFVYPPDGFLRLGDVVISYPQTVERAGEDDMLVDDKINELLIHGLNNLIGKGD